jgi:Zn-dependent protease with chaperone function
MIAAPPRRFRLRYDEHAPVPAHLDISFAEYVAARKGQASMRLREGAAYAYGGDLATRGTLDRLPPVKMATAAGVRFWGGVGKARVLGEAVRVSERQFPRLDELLARCAQTLQIPRPALFVSPHAAGLDAYTFGGVDESTIVLGSALVDKLDDGELVAVLGRECGHIQNGHVAHLTTLYFLRNAGNLLVRWAAQPAVLALRRWGRRADITCDRAAALCTRDLDVTTRALVKLALGSTRLYSDVNVDAYLRELARPAPVAEAAELAAEQPLLPRRLQALRCFAETTYWKSVVGGAGGAASPGITREECDARVAEILEA